MDATLVGGELRSVNPATLEVVGAVAVTPLEAVTEAVTEARLAQQQWARTSFAERRALLAAVAQLLLERMDEIAATVTAETAKPLVEAFLSDVMVAVDNTVWIAENAEGALGPERLRYPQLYLRHKRGRIEYVPLGAVAVISPWNFPFAIPYTETAMAVAAGNAVLVKPSELTPLSGAWVERVFEEAGAPRGLVRVVQGDGELGAALVRARGIAKVFFTGSTEVGRRVAAAAGERLCPVTLELGGKDPMIVFADADVERALDGAAWGSFFNCGQVCSGSSGSSSSRSCTTASSPGSPSGRGRCGSGAATTSTAISARSSPRSSARRSRRSSRRPATPSSPAAAAPRRDSPAGSTSRR